MSIQAVESVVSTVVLSDAVVSEYKLLDDQIKLLEERKSELRKVLLAHKIEGSDKTVVETDSFKVVISEHLQERAAGVKDLVAKFGRDQMADLISVSPVVKVKVEVKLSAVKPSATELAKSLLNK